jgi:hypothetical protein
MKLSKQKLKQIIKEELEELNEQKTGLPDPAKLLGGINVRLDQHLDQLSNIAEDNPTPEGKFLRKLWSDLNQIYIASHRYKDLGERS